MLKLVLLVCSSIFSFSTILAGAAAIIADQNEHITTAQPKKNIRELCDETIFYFMVNPDSANKLLSLTESVRQKKSANEKIRSLANCKALSVLTNNTERDVIRLAAKLNLINVINAMHKMKECASVKTESATRTINFNQPF